MNFVISKTKIVLEVRVLRHSKSFTYFSPSSITSIGSRFSSFNTFVEPFDSKVFLLCVEQNKFLKLLLHQLFFVFVNWSNSIPTQQKWWESSNKRSSLHETYEMGSHSQREAFYMDRKSVDVRLNNNQQNFNACCLFHVSLSLHFSNLIIVVETTFTEKQAD